MGRDDLTVALSAALAGVNDDVGEAGYSLAQWVLARAPRRFASTLGGGARCLATHSAAEVEAEFPRRVGMMETSRIALTRLKFSRKLRSSLLAGTQSRGEALELKVGDIVYFFRKQARQSGAGKKKGKLVFNTWRGPGILLGIEGNTGMHIGYKGHVTKCAPEAVRLATSHEQLAEDRRGLGQCLGGCPGVGTAVSRPAGTGRTSCAASASKGARDRRDVRDRRLLGGVASSDSGRAVGGTAGDDGPGAPCTSRADIAGDCSGTTRRGRCEHGAVLSDTTLAGRNRTRGVTAKTPT